MKKIFYLAAALGVCVFFQANASDNASNNLLTEANYTLGWVNDGVVTLKFFGRNVRGTASGQHPIQYDSTTGSYRVNFKGNWYNVHRSDRDDFSYMIHADKTYYFNH